MASRTSRPSVWKLPCVSPLADAFDSPRYCDVLSKGEIPQPNRRAQCCSASDPTFGFVWPAARSADLLQLVPAGRAGHLCIDPATALGPDLSSLDGPDRIAGEPSRSWHDRSQRLCDRREAGRFPRTSSCDSGPFRSCKGNRAHGTKLSTLLGRFPRTILILDITPLKSASHLRWKLPELRACYGETWLVPYSSPCERLPRLPTKRLRPAARIG